MTDLHLLNIPRERLYANLSLQELRGRKAACGIIAGGVLIALSYPTLFEALDDLKERFDTTNSTSAEYRKAALRIAKHHRAKMMELVQACKDDEDAMTTVIANYIYTHWTSENGTMTGKVGGKLVYLPRLSLMDAKKDAALRATPAPLKKVAEEVAEEVVEDVVAVVCNAKKVEATIAAICKMLADDVEEIQPLQESFAYALGVITGAIPTNNVEVDALLNVARKDYAAIIERSVKRELKAA